MLACAGYVIEKIDGFTPSLSVTDNETATHYIARFHLSIAALHKCDYCLASFNAAFIQAHNRKVLYSIFFFLAYCESSESINSQIESEAKDKLIMYFPYSMHYKVSLIPTALEMLIKEHCRDL